MLWTCLHFPDLPVDALCRAQADERPLAVTQRCRGARLIVSANCHARARGIARNMPAATALALAPDLRLLERDTGRETRALRRMAGWAGQFSARISLSPLRQILVETGASQRLFGNPQALMQRMRDGAAELGYTLHLAQAPTPLAAELLVRRQDGGLIETTGELTAKLADVPTSMLTLPAETITALRHAGLRRLADCLRLPRAALAQRLGPDCVQYLDRLLGRQPDPRRLFHIPPCFRSRLELPTEIIHSEALLFAIRRVLLELGGALRGRDAAIEMLRLRLEHADVPPTRLSVGLLNASSHVDHLTSLVRERLDHLALVAPVRAIEISTPRFVAAAHPAPDLFDRQAQSRANWQQLIEKMRVRLGDDAVFGLTVTADHRPERAWRKTAPGGEVDAATEGRDHRPLWLLDNPGELPTPPPHSTLEQGPERIESGWWDGAGVRRDYFVMRGENGMRWWVYREGCYEQRWFVHGLFT